MIQTSCSVFLDKPVDARVWRAKAGDSIVFQVEEELTYGGVTFYVNEMAQLRTIAKALNDFLEGEVA